LIALLASMFVLIPGEVTGYEYVFFLGGEANQISVGAAAVNDYGMTPAIHVPTPVKFKPRCSAVCIAKLRRRLAGLDE
jgi:hypothetical protein